MFLRLVRRQRPGFRHLPPLALLAQALSERGHEITMLTTAAPDGAFVDKEPFGEVRYLDGTHPNRVDAAYFKASAASFDALHAERRFDMVFGRGAAHWGFFSHSRFAGELPSVALVGTYPRWIHQIDTRFPRAAPAIVRSAAPIVDLAERAKGRSLLPCFRRTDRVVCNSPAILDGLRRAYWWDPPRTVFIPYGFEMTGYGVAEPTQPPRLVFLGRLASNKGLTTLLDVLARLKRRDVVLDAIGPVDEPIRRALESHAEGLGLGDRFRMAGPVEHAEVGRRLQGATAFVFASTHNEGLPKAVMEAMAAGLPVVSYALPGMEALVDDGVTGYLAPPRDVDRFRESVDALLADPGNAVRMGLAGRRRIETEFEREEIMKHWDALFGEIMAERGEAAG